MVSKTGCVALLLASSVALALGSSCAPCEEGGYSHGSGSSVYVLPQLKTDSTVRFTDDPTLVSSTSGCITVYQRIAKDMRLTTFKKLVDRFGAQGILNKTDSVITVLAFTDAALLKAIGRWGYNLDDFLNLPAAVLTGILNNHIIVNQTVTSGTVMTKVIQVKTIFYKSNPGYMNSYLGKWEKLCFAPSTNYTEGCARCGNKDLASCAGILHIIDFPLFQIALPTAPPKPGCSTVYSYISARSDMGDLKAAIDRAGLQSLFNATRSPGTFFLPTDRSVMTLLSINGFPQRRLADMDVGFIRAFLGMHALANATQFSYQLTSGYTYLTAMANTWLLADINAALNNKIMIWNEVSNVTVVEADIAKCSAVVHIINQPLTPVGFVPITAAPDLSTYGPFKSVADLLSTAPTLSGMYDIIGASPLAEVSASCTTFGTWFIATNQALCRMARRGLSTQLLFTNKQLLLNFVNSQVIPYSSLPFATLANGVALKTAFSPVTITIAKADSVTTVPSGVDISVEMFNVLDQSKTVSQVNFGAYDLKCGKAIANLVDDALLSKALGVPLKTLSGAPVTKK